MPLRTDEHVSVQQNATVWFFFIMLICSYYMLLCIVFSIELPRHCQHPCGASCVIVVTLLGNAICNYLLNI